MEAYLAALDHPMIDGVRRLRAAVLDSDADISETVKWNAPNFRYAGEDRVTFRLQPGNRLQLIFHRGAKMRADTAQFVFTDTTGLITWATPDRGIVDFPDLASVDARLVDVVALVNRWVVA